MNPIQVGECRNSRLRRRREAGLVIRVMSLEEDLVLKGAPMGPIPDCSLGEYLMQKMKLLPQDHIIQVDGDTGARQTVGELLALSARVSEGLRKLGLKEGDVVGMVCRNCFEASAIVLGSWLSAATIVPLDVKMKVDEIKHALELSQPKFIFCEEEPARNVTAALDVLLMSPAVILVAETKKPQHSHLIFSEVLPEVDLARYVPQSVKSPSTQVSTILFSSGTSGLAKAVGVTHSNFIFQDLQMNTIWSFIERRDVLQISQFFWVTAHLMFIHSLTSGMRRVLLRSPTESNILKAIERYKPHWSMMAPLLVLSVASHPDFKKFDLSSLKFIMVGGSPFTSRLGEKLKEMWEDLKFVQCYGTTEVTGTIAITSEGTDVYSLGKVTPGVELKVVDVETGRSLRPNASGEIWIRSPGMMKCYLKDPEATRQALDENGWFHTGDIGYHDNSGQFYIVDRMKDVVKIMNFQVAPLEIENAILSIPGVTEAFVTGVTRGGNVYELLGLVVKEKGSPVTEELIKAHVANTLSEYKRLTAGVHFVDNLPKTGSGKIKRGELRKVAQELFSTGS